MEPLNVLIGPNGSGKSNLLEIFSLLRAAPTNLPRPIKEMGGVQEWFWKGPNSTRSAKLDVVVAKRSGQQNIRHVLEIGENGERFEVLDETIENERPSSGKQTPYFFYRFNRGAPRIQDYSENERGLRRETVRPEESILSQVRDPESYPVLHWLEERYERIRLYRNWTFGPSAPTRKSQSAHGQSDLLSDDGENLPIVLSNIRAKVKRPLIESLQQLIDGVEDIGFSIEGGNVQLFLEEGGGRSIPASRLSDGTLRYLSLLTVLLHPEPPPLVAIEEPRAWPPLRRDSPHRRAIGFRLATHAARGDNTLATVDRNSTRCFARLGLYSSQLRDSEKGCLGSCADREGRKRSISSERKRSPRARRSGSTSSATT